MTVSKAMNLLPISSACLLSGIISLYYNGINFSDACVFVLFGRNGVYQAERGCLHFKTRLSVAMKTVIQVGVMIYGQETVLSLIKVWKCSLQRT